SCATNPVSGGPELMLLSESEEIQLGKQTDTEVRKEYGVYEDQKLNAYLNDMCQRLAKVSHRPNLPYKFEIVDASAVNAFAVPGGYVYFTRGILANLNNEAELAGVMGHEIGHITARHSAQQYSRAQLAQFGLVVGGLFMPDLVSGVAQLGVGMLFLSFSRDNERQADSLGVEYASKAGYDARELAAFFETLERMNPGSDRSGLPGWFSTHPSPEDRVVTVRKEAREWQQKLGMKESKLNREVYLKHIDGLVYGDDPRQGYVDEGIFYHPDMGFQFPIPANWKVNNTPSQVQIMNENKEGGIIFSVANAPSPKEAAAKFVQANRASVLASDSVTVGGFPAHRLVCNIKGESSTIRVVSYFIHKDKSIFYFHGLSAPSVFDKHLNTFEKTMSGFKELSDPKKINVKPDRIRLRTTKAAGSVESAFRTMGIPKDDLDDIALLNGMELSENLPANTLVKVIEKGH
ncbi:MAG: peptidase, partial [Deltaproteobacteria bacterium]|nr:peptidase [Deltaproteobacteria bacterium]